MKNEMDSNTARSDCRVTKPRYDVCTITVYWDEILMKTQML